MPRCVEPVVLPFFTLPGMRSLSSALLTGVRGQIVCDGGAVVAGIVDFVVSRRRSLRLLSGLVERSATARHGAHRGQRGALLRRRPAARRAAAPWSSRAGPTNAGKWTLCGASIPDVAWTPVAFEWRPAAMLAALQTFRRPLSDLRRTARLARRLVRRFGVFRALRAVELIAYYRRYVQLLDSRPFTLAVMSSHSNPHGIALNAAARRSGIPVVLITHGMPVRPIARLDYELAIHECEASLPRLRGCRVPDASHRRQEPPGRIPFAAATMARELEESRHLPVQGPRRGPGLACVRALIGDPRTQQVLIRPHPINLWHGLADAVASLRRRARHRAVVDAAPATTFARATSCSAATRRCCSTRSSPARRHATSAGSITDRTTCRTSCATGSSTSCRSSRPSTPAPSRGSTRVASGRPSCAATRPSIVSPDDVACAVRSALSGTTSSIRSVA